jgi:hypothetical protein
VSNIIAVSIVGFIAYNNNNNNNFMFYLPQVKNAFLDSLPGCVETEMDLSKASNKPRVCHNFGHCPSSSLRTPALFLLGPSEYDPPEDGENPVTETSCLSKRQDHG